LLFKGDYANKGVLDISGTHEFEYIPQKNLVPIRKTFKIVKGKNDDDIKILGGTIQFDGDVRKISKPENTFRYYLSAIENR
jgi:hypothetical protein